MEAILETKYALDTFYFLVSGALVMWMAAGFAMLEAGALGSGLSGSGPTIFAWARPADRAAAIEAIRKAAG